MQVANMHQSLTDRFANYEASHKHGLGLAQPVDSIDGLALCCLIPCRPCELVMAQRRMR